VKKLKLLLLRLYSGLFFCVSASVFLFIISCSKQKIPTIGRTISFDQDWHFIKDSLPGAQAPAYNDTGWRIIDIPHDWSIEDLPDQNGEDII
jgi:beta-galactosidase